VTPAGAERDLDMALHKVATCVERLGAEAWSLSLTNGSAVEARAHLDDVWLVLETTPPASARLECEAMTEWGVLASNGALHGGVRRVLDGRDEVVRMRAEIPLDADIDLLRRVADVCAGFVRASAAGTDGLAPSVQQTAGETGADPELLQSCRQTGWPCRPLESGSVEVDLDVPGGFHLATVGRRGEGYVADVILLGEGPSAVGVASEVRRRAVAVLLLRASGGLRMVRAAGELSHALAALSVGCRMAAREASVLWADAELAGAYLERWDAARKRAA
jgi:hypothetical protein